MSVNPHMHEEAPDADELALLAELIERGLLIESGVPGVYGHGARSRTSELAWTR